MSQQVFHILVVEDHRDTASSLARLLRHSGYHVTAAATLSEVCALAKSFRFNFLICDVGLPDGDGCEALAEVRKRYPVDGIIVSGYGAPEDLARTRALGYAAHLVKPVGFDEVLAAVQQHARIAEPDGNTLSSPTAV